MRNTWAVCKREFVSYFITPVGYVVAGVFALISGIGFAASFIGYARATQSPSAYGYTCVPEFDSRESRTMGRSSPPTSRQLLISHL